jgi:hypothetical protein
MHRQCCCCTVPNSSHMFRDLIPALADRWRVVAPDCGWFVYFDESDKVTRIVQYDDTQLVNDMTVRVATAQMKGLQHG